MDHQQTYQVTLPETDGISLVAQQRHASFSGRVLDMSLDAVRAYSVSSDLSSSGCSALAVGWEVELALTFVDPPKSLVVSATVVSRNDKDDSSLYGFRFNDPQEVASQLSQGFSRFFNRRGSYRVTPDPDAAVKVTLDGGTESTRR